MYSVVFRFVIKLGIIQRFCAWWRWEGEVKKLGRLPSACFSVAEFSLSHYDTHQIARAGAHKHAAHELKPNSTLKK